MYLGLILISVTIILLLSCAASTEMHLKDRLDDFELQLSPGSAIPRLEISCIQAFLGDFLYFLEVVGLDPRAHRCRTPSINGEIPICRGIPKTYFHFSFFSKLAQPEDQIEIKKKRGKEWAHGRSNSCKATWQQWIGREIY